MKSRSRGLGRTPLSFRTHFVPRSAAASGSISHHSPGPPGRLVGFALRLAQTAIEKQCRRRGTDGNLDEPIPGDPEDPVYRAGSWATASIGRQYDEMSFEVMRTGVEGLHTNHGFDMVSDPDHQAFVLGALAAL